ncbi:hypothetical protein NSQ59_27235 [Margalitia sp. FSL K6-0131]|uniref:hypothetical protein n=1 Tax=Margalitia sp. FSL K6-0131 TaxID=2954604 RepID=UPI0030F64331
MNFEQAKETMKNGVPIQSLVSKTVYQISKDNLIAEGIPVPFDYLTEEEVNGKWMEVRLIDTMEEYEALSENDKKMILTEAFVQYEFNLKYGR